MSRMRRVVRFAIGCLLLGIIAAVSVVLYARSDAAAERLRRLVVQVGSTQLGADLYVQKLEIEQLLPPAVVLTEITLHDAQGLPLARVDEVRVALDALPRRRLLAIRSVQITGPSVRLALEDGKLRDFSKLFETRKPAAPGPQMKVQLGALHVDRAAVRLTVEPAGLAVSLEGIALAFSQDAAGNGSGRLGIQAIDVSIGPVTESASLEPSNFTVEGGVVTVGESALELASGRVELSGGVTLPDPPGAPNARPMSYGLTARAAVEMDRLKKIWPELPVMEGHIDAAIGLSGQGREPLVTFNIQAQNVRVHLTKPRPMVLKGEDASLIGHFRDGHVVLEEESALHWGGGVVKPQGWFDLTGTMPFQVELELRGLKLEQALDSATVPGSWVTMGLGGTLELAGHAKGGLAATGSGFVNVRELLVGDRAWDSGQERTIMLRVPKATIAAKLSMTGKHLLLSPATIRGPHGTDIDISCDFLFLKPLGLVIDLRTSTFDMRDIENTIAGLHLEGVGGVAANIEGPTNDLGIRGEIELDDFMFLDWPFGRVGGEVRWHTRQDLEFLALRGRKGTSDFESEVRVQFADVRRGGTRERVEVAVDVVVPEGHGRAEDLLSIFFGDAIAARGNAWGSVELQGPPSALSGTAEVHGTDVSYLWETFSSVEIEATMDAGRLIIDSGHASKPNGEALSASGWLAPGGDLDFTFRLPGMELRQFDPVRAVFPGAPSSDLVELAGGTGPWVDGRAAGEVFVKGNLENIVLDGELEVSDFIYRGTYLGDSTVEMKIRDHEFKTWGWLLDRRIEALATVWTQQLLLYNYDLKWGDFSLTPYLPRTILAQRDPVTAGMTGLIHGDGTLKDDFHDVHLTLDEIWLERGRHRIENRGAVKVLYSGGALRFQSVNFISPEEGDGTTDFGVRGWVRPDGPLSVEVGGKVDIAFADLASDVFDRVEAEALGLQANITGTTRVVDISGSAYMQGALLKTIYWPHPIEVDEAEVRLEDGVLTLTKFSGAMGGGRLENLAGSTISLDRTGYRVRRYDLKGDCVECTIRYPSFMPPVTATANLTFTGRTPDDLLLSGRLHVMEMVLRDPLNWQRSVLTFQRRFTETVARAENKGLFRIELTFDSDPGQLRMDNNVGELAGTADGFRIRGDTNHVILEGAVELTSGTLPYQGHDFELQGGVARFRDSDSWFPSLEGVTMTTEVVSRDETYEITYNVDGPLNALQLEATSDPFLNDSDINLLLLFGLTQEQLADADVAELLAAGAGTAVGAYGETAATSFGQSVRGTQLADLFLPDRVEIVPVYTETTGATTVWAVATKEVVPDLLTLEGGVGLFTTGQLQVPTVARAQLRFRREVYLEGSWLRDDAASTSLGNFGLDLKFEIKID